MFLVKLLHLNACFIVLCSACHSWHHVDYLLSILGPCSMAVISLRILLMPTWHIYRWIDSHINWAFTSFQNMSYAICWVILLSCHLCSECSISLYYGIVNTQIWFLSWEYFLIYTIQYLQNLLCQSCYFVHCCANFASVFY